MPGRNAFNVILSVQDPLRDTGETDPIVARMDAFLEARGKSLATIANTIFPQALFENHGRAKFIDVFHTRVLPKVRKSSRWSGYYFERMTAGDNVLGDIIQRMNSSVALHKYELSIFDAKRDVDGSPYGGQCLSFLSFHVIPGATRTLALTAQYRNHYYVEKLLGNLIGLGRLMAFVASETGCHVGPLTVLSTHAIVDAPKPCTRADIVQLLA